MAVPLTLASIPVRGELAGARARQRDPAWLADYRATRPKVERKLAHLLRRRHGGRRARVRGLVRVAQDFSCWPPRSTWLAWPPSGCALAAPAGSSSPPNGGDQLSRHLPGNRYLNAAELLQLVREHRPPRKVAGRK